MVKSKLVGLQLEKAGERLDAAKYLLRAGIMRMRLAGPTTLCIMRRGQY